MVAVSELSRLHLDLLVPDVVLAPVQARHRERDHRGLGEVDEAKAAGHLGLEVEDRDGVAHFVSPPFLLSPLLELIRGGVRG